jgi:hypothetical protein
MRDLAAGFFALAAGFNSEKLMKSKVFFKGLELGISSKLSSFQWLNSRKISWVLIFSALTPASRGLLNPRLFFLF